MKPVCPKCRAEGLSTDCADLLTPPGRTPMSDTPYEVEVTLTFATLAPPNSLAEPNELATLMRERWIEEPNTLVTVVIDAILDHDYHLKVLPGYGP